MSEILLFVLLLNVKPCFLEKVENILKCFLLDVKSDILSAKKISALINVSE